MERFRTNGWSLLMTEDMMAAGQLLGSCEGVDTDEGEWTAGERFPAKQQRQQLKLHFLISVSLLYGFHGLLTLLSKEWDSLFD